MALILRKVESPLSPTQPPPHLLWSLRQLWRPRAPEKDPVYTLFYRQWDQGDRQGEQSLHPLVLYIVLKCVFHLILPTEVQKHNITSPKLHSCILKVHRSANKYKAELIGGVPIMAQWKRIWLGFMRMQVQSLASLSGSRIQHCWELWCRSKMRLGSSVAVAVVSAGSYSFDSNPSLRTSIWHGCGPKKTKKKKKKRKTDKLNS